MDVPHVAYGYVILCHPAGLLQSYFWNASDSFAYTNIEQFTIAQSVILFVLFYCIFQPIFNSLSLIEFIIKCGLHHCKHYLQFPFCFD